MKKDASNEDKKARSQQRAAHQAAGWIRLIPAKASGGLGRARMIRRADYEAGVQ